MTNEIQILVDTMCEMTKLERSNYHLTLGELIDKLKQFNKKMIVKIDFNNLSPAAAMSYRGYYSDLAFDWSNDDINVQDFLDICKNTINTELEGYKGGEFLMESNTPVWIDEYSIAMGCAVMDIKICGNVVKIITKHIIDKE